MPAEQQLSQIWPEWQIEEQLGRGSYGTVYKAVRKDNNVESHAAIKMISIPSDHSEVDSLRSEGLDLNGTKRYFKGIVDDFVQEIQLMESLKGIQNIVSVEDYRVVERSDTIGWDIYIRMELLKPFNTYLCDNTMSESDVIKLGKDICSALEICGQRNIIHRDIKPENIFVNDFGYFKLGDFGIARKLENMTGGLSQKGTYNYMAPEVANSSSYDARVDIYSLGILLYRLLNKNRLPFIDSEEQLLNPNERKSAVERRLRGEELLPPCDASPQMANLILRACSYDPDQRFMTAGEMKNALSQIETGTYTPITLDTDKTVAVRRAAVDPNATTAVRHAPHETPTPKEPTPTFGKKKSKLPRVIAILVIIVCLLAGALVAYPHVRDYLSGDETKTDDTKETKKRKTTTAVTTIENSIRITTAAPTVTPAGVTTVAPTVTTEASPVMTAPSPTTTQELVTTAAPTPITTELPQITTTTTTVEVTTAPPTTSDVPIDNTEKIQAILNDAEILANAGKFEEAIAKLDSGLLTYPGSAELANKRTEYKNKLDNKEHKPDTHLYELQYTNFNHNGYTNNKLFLINNKVTSFLGDTYNEGLLLQMGKKYRAAITYDLGGRYSLLTGKISMIASGKILGTSFTAGSDDLARLEFYGDGDLIYTSARTNPTMDIDFSVDLTGVKSLEIRIVPDGEHAYSGMNSCFALTGLEMYKVGNVPTVISTKANNLLKLQHSSFNHNGYTNNKLFLINNKVTSFLGDTYNEGLLLQMGKKYRAAITYDLGGRYSLLTGKISMIASGKILGTSFTAGSDDLARIEFYGDGDLIYTSARTNPTMDIDFSVDLTGVKSLEIRIVPDNEDGGGMNSCFALTGLEMYKVGNVPTVISTKANNLLKLQHSNFNHNGRTNNKLFLINNKVTSFLGDTYNEGLLLQMGKKYRAAITYDLGGKYSLLTGKISMIASGKILGNSFTAGSDDLARIEFYGDGDLIYTSARTNPTMDIDFSVDLTGVKSLEIRIVPDNEDGGGMNSCFALTGLELS